MDDREGRFHRGMREIGEVVADLLGQQHAFVDERLHRQARDIPRLGTGYGRGADIVVGALADDEELTLEIQVGGDIGTAADEDLAHERFARLGRLAEALVVGRHGAPAEKHLALGLHHLLEHFLDLAANGAVARKINETCAVVAGLGQRDARGLGDFREKLVRHLNQDTGTVTGVGLAAGGAAVVEIGENLECVRDDLVRFPALHIDDEADPAGIVLKRGIVEALFAGWTRERRRGGLIG